MRLRIAQDLLDRVKQAARQIGTTQSEFTRTALREKTNFVPLPSKKP